MKKRILIGTGNVLKGAELVKLLKGTVPDVEFVLPTDIGFRIPDVVEDEPGYSSNALKKAREIAEASGLPTLADDSGIELDALNGKPGLLSARYKGSSNVVESLTKINHEMEKKTNRRVKSVCAIAYYDPSTKSSVVQQDEVYGVYGHEDKLNDDYTRLSYDLRFIPEGYTLPYSELGQELKNKLSAKYKAVQGITMKLRVITKSRGK